MQDRRLVQCSLCQRYPMTTWIPDLFKLEARVFYDVIESERGRTKMSLLILEQHFEVAHNYIIGPLLLSYVLRLHCNNEVACHCPKFSRTLHW